MLEDMNDEADPPGLREAVRLRGECAQLKARCEVKTNEKIRET